MDPELRASERLKHLEVLEALQGSKNVKIELTDDMNVSATKVCAATADLSQIIVENLCTPLGTLPHASIRGENVIAIEVSLESEKGLKKKDK